MTSYEYFTVIFLNKTKEGLSQINFAGIVNHFRLTKQSRTMSSIKVRISYEYADGLRTTFHCPKPARIKHEPYRYTCKPKTIKVKFTYEHSEGLRTTFEYPQEIVLKHYVYVEPKKECNDTINYEVVREFGPMHYL